MSEESILVFEDADALARAAATEWRRAAEISVAERGAFFVALAGGSTPKRLYHLLATDPAFQGLPWDKTHFFFGDERHVPPDDKDSNYLMVKMSLLSTNLIPARNVHRIQAEMPEADKAAAAYAAEMHAFFGEDLRLHGAPRFDLILLGMGPDGHTASLFPESRGLDEMTRWVIANPVAKFKTDRITFTYPVLDAAREVHLLVAGDDKAEMIAQVLDKNRKGAPYPVQRVQPADGKKVWMLDRAAAAHLPQAS